MTNTCDIYFCLKLTENEHYIVEDFIQDYCKLNNLELNYYRKLKEGHVPMFREVKVSGPQIEINKFLHWAKDGEHRIFENEERNPHKY